jgi:SAM-dependent methyltransferase
MSGKSTTSSERPRSQGGGLFVQYGCGLSAPDGWINFDASPTLRLQKIPIVGNLVTRGRAAFPRSVLYGDVTKGLPIKTGSCDGVYASHVLEHLALDDFYRALEETLRILRTGGRFRLIVPCLQQLAGDYLEAARNADADASHKFMKNAYLGMASRPKTLKEKLIAGTGNSDHLWMWDRVSMRAALSGAGFEQIREARFGDSDELAFSRVEDSGRFEGAIAFEAMK